MTLENSLFGALNLTKKDDISTNILDMVLHLMEKEKVVDLVLLYILITRKKYFLILGQGSRQGFDGTTQTSDKCIQLILLQLKKDFV